MRLAPGIVALVWLWPLATRADDPPTSHDVPNDLCGPSEPEVHPPPPQSPLEARLAALEAQLQALEATREAPLTAADATEAAKDPMFRLYGFIDMGLQKLWATDDPVTPTQK